MIFGNEITLTSYGTIATKGKEYSIEDFEKQLKEKYFKVKDFSFDLENRCFHFDFDEGFHGDRWGKRSCIFNISTEHKKLLDDGIIAPDLQRLIDIAKEIQEKNKSEEVIKRVLKTGDFPTEADEIALYRKHLIKELEKTKASIITGSICAATPIVSSLIFYKLFKYGVNVEDLASALPFYIGESTAAVTTIVSTLMLVFNELSPFKKSGINLIKDGLSDGKLISNKLEGLKRTEEGRSVIDIPVDMFAKGLKKEEHEKVEEYQNLFLQEVNNVRENILKIPANEREAYIRVLTILLEVYMKRINHIISKPYKEIELGVASDIWQLNVEMFPDLFRLSSVVSERLANYKGEKELLDDCKKLQEEIQKGLVQNEYTGENIVGYTEGYTEGYTDDLSLGSGGVAYADVEQKVAK